MIFDEFGPLLINLPTLPKKASIVKTCTPTQDNGNVTETTFDGVWRSGGHTESEGWNSTDFESAGSEAESTVMELPEVLRVWDSRRRSPYGT